MPTEPPTNPIPTDMKFKNILTLIAILLSVAGYAQRQITGSVRSSADTTALPGVVVIELGTNNAVTTDSQGNYKINVRSESSVLTFSSLGYVQQQQNVGSRRVIGVLLQPDTYAIDAVVAIGYGTTTKSDLTGSVGSLKSRDIESSTALSVNDIMSGRMAGVMVTSSGGEPGAGFSIRIRGAGSINADMEPLYVIDGIPYEKTATQSSAFSGMGTSTLDPLALLNPADIESLEVLKDASATAIYGSRGANGVILITTKSGKQGQTKISYSGSVGVAVKPQKEMEMLNAQEYADYQYNIMRYGGVAHNYRYIDDQMMPVSYADSVGHNWQREMFRTALQQNHNVSVSGGSQSGDYAVSVGHTSQEGIIENSSYERTTMRINLNQRITRRLKGNAMLTYTSTTQNGSVISSDVGVGAAAGVIQQMLVFRPVNVGSLDEIDMEQTPPVSNPLLYNEQAVRKNTINRTQYAFSLTYEILPELNLRTAYSGFVNNVRTKEFMPKVVGPGYQTNGKNTSAYGTDTKWVSETTLNFKKQFNRISRIDAMLGFTVESLRNRTESTTVQNILDETLGEESMGWGTEVALPVTNSITETSLMSVFGRVNYTYRNRYLFTASLRADGSSKFRKGNKFSYFPSAAFAWRISEENFMRSQDVVSNLKLRLSYGRTGNQSIGAYSTFDRMSLAYTLYSEKNLAGGIYPSQIGSQDLRWETTDQYNIGIDLGLFNNRINLTADLYRKNSTDLLLQQPVSHTTGADYIVNNIGSVRNQGVEFALNAMVVDNRNFRWETNFNLSMNRNEVLDLGSVDYYLVDPSNNTQFINAFILRKGGSVGDMYGYKYRGVYQYGDFVEFYDVDPVSGAMTLKSPEECLALYKPNKRYTPMPGVADRASVNVAPGFAKYADLDGNGIVNDLDRTVIGHSEPKFYGGWTNSFNYKNIDLKLFVQYSYGNDIFNASMSAYGTAMRLNNKTREIWQGSWKPNAPQNEYPYTTDISGSRDLASSMSVEDGSYIRIKEITLGYTFPTRLISRLGIANLRVYVTAQNLWTISNYSYYDPEVSFRNPLASGWDKFSYPRPRTVMGGVAITF